VFGGLGRSGVRQNGQTGPGSCNPENNTFVNCDISATLNLSRPARVLVIGSVQASPDPGTNEGLGECQLGTTGGPIAGSAVSIDVQDDPDLIYGSRESVSIAGVTVVFPAGQHSFGIDCRETGGVDGITYFGSQVTAVALSDQ
jgi:hypothetical protein